MWRTALPPHPRLAGRVLATVSLAAGLLLPTALGGRAHASGPGAWTGSWATAPQPPAGTAATGFTDRTLREIVRLGAGGEQVRIRVTDVFGPSALSLDSVTVGLRAEGADLVPGTERRVTFSGHRDVVLPAGTETFSDPVDLVTRPGQDLAVSLYASGTTPAPTAHALALTTSYTAGGDHSADTGAGAFTGTTTAWSFLDGVDVHGLCPARTVVALGDSITDGVHATTDAHATWPDGLARRLAARPGCRTSVLNEGINANRLLTDNTPVPDTAQARWDRDVLGQTGVRTVVLLEGVNDIGHDLSATGGPVTARDVTDAYQALIRSAHGRGLRVIGGTLLPVGGSKYDTPAAERTRAEVNAWIRGGGSFDGVVDFDRAVRDPAAPDRILPAYDSGDGLHPDDAGYRAMADAIDLALVRSGS